MNAEELHKGALCLAIKLEAAKVLVAQCLYVRQRSMTGAIAPAHADRNADSTCTNVTRCMQSCQKHSLSVDGIASPFKLVRHCPAYICPTECMQTSTAMNSCAESALRAPFGERGKHVTPRAECLLTGLFPVCPNSVHLLCVFWSPPLAGGWRSC